MKLSKAIELNHQSEKSLRQHKFGDHADALKLGIEALKREKISRGTLRPGLYPLLPGETEE